MPIDRSIGIAGHPQAYRFDRRLGFRWARQFLDISYYLTCLLDWLWDLRLRAEQRDVVHRMTARERADIGLGACVRGEDSAVGFWRY